MEWFLIGMYWPAIATAFTAADPQWTSPAAAPTDLDLWLIRLVYEANTSQTRCGKCGAQLNRRMRLATQHGARSQFWRVSVATNCHGWRRHRHLALVTETSSGLQLGPLSNRIAS